MYQKLAALLLTLLLLCAMLVGCLSANGSVETVPPTEPADGSGQLEYPGLAWDASPEEVIAILGLQEGDFEDATEPPQDTYPIYSYVMLLENVPCLGGEAAKLYFRFVDYGGTGDNLGLASVSVAYGDSEEEAAAVRETLTALYGQPVEGYSTYERWWDGLQLREHTPGEEDSWWLPETKADTYFTQAQKERMYQFFADQEDPLTQEETDMFLEGRPLVTVKLSYLSGEMFGKTITSHYEVYFDANDLVHAQQQLGG